MDWNPADDTPVGEVNGGMAPAGGPNAKVFIGNLAWAVTSEQLRECLEAAGGLTSCEVQYAGEGHSKGFGLAEFSDASGAANAIATLNDHELEGRRIFIREDRPPAQRQKAPRGPRGGGGGEGGGGREEGGTVRTGDKGSGGGRV